MSLDILPIISLTALLVISILFWVANRRLNEKYVEELRKATQLEAELKAERKNLKESKQLLENSKVEMAKEFEIAANRILESKSETFSKQNKKAIEQLLEPFKDQLERFDRRIVTSRTEDAK